MNFKSKIEGKILNESIESRIEEISKKIGEIQEVDNFDLEVGSEYEYKKDEDSKPKRVKFLKRGKKSSHGPFYFEDSKGKEIMMGEKQLDKMKKIHSKHEENEGNAFTKKLKDTPKGEKFKMGNKEYTDNSSLEEMIHSELEEKLYGGQKKLDKNDNGRIDSEDFKMLRKGKKSEMDEDLAGMHDVFGDVNLSKIPEEEKQEGGKFAKYYRNNPLSLKDKRKEDDKEDQEDEFDTMAESVKSNDVVYNVTFGNENVSLTETEMVDLIEEIVKEETTKSRGMDIYGKVSKKEKDTNNDAMKSVKEKMSNYVKAGSKGKFEMNPKMFPKGNGELGEMKKMAYRPSDAVAEYIENFAYAPAMENLSPDEIGYNEEWVEDNIKGSARTGNSPKYANAVETELGEKIVKKHKDNLYKKEKDRSYNRVKQPVDVAGHDKKSNKLDDMFKKLGESKEDEKQKLVNEEMSRMKTLLSYTNKEV